MKTGEIVKNREKESFFETGEKCMSFWDIIIMGIEKFSVDEKEVIRNFGWTPLEARRENYNIHRKKSSSDETSYDEPSYDIKSM